MGTGRPHAQFERERGLLAFYTEQSGNRLKERDRDALRKVSHLSDHAIQAGILKSILGCRGRVNSFVYCLGAIRECAADDVGPEDLARCLARVGAKKAGAQPNLPSIGADVVRLEAQGRSSKSGSTIEPEPMPGIPKPEPLAAFLAAVRAKVNPETYQIWFAPIDRLSIEGDLVRLSVPNDTFGKQIALQYFDVVEEAMNEVGLSVRQLEYFDGRPARNFAASRGGIAMRRSSTKKGVTVLWQIPGSRRELQPGGNLSEALV